MTLEEIQGRVQEIYEHEQRAGAEVSNAHLDRAIALTTVLITDLITAIEGE